METVSTDCAGLAGMLAGILDEFACQTGTIHETTDDGGFLKLVCEIGVPEPLLAKIARIPFGKGIAGVAAETRQPVELCNLQEDLGGVAKIAARQTGAAGSIAIPVLSDDREKVLGVLGIGKFTPHEFSEEEIGRLAAHARCIATHMMEHSH